MRGALTFVPCRHCSVRFFEHVGGMKSRQTNNVTEAGDAEGERPNTLAPHTAVRRRGRRFVARCSSGLSVFVMLLAGVAGYVTHVLGTRAIWSGEAAPNAWRAAADPDDVFAVDGRTIAYWGDPDARYSSYATRKRRPPVAIVVHYTAAKPVKNLVAYGHMSDANRGGASFGYHFYIGRDGEIVQGAPLSRRTNHIKFKTNKMRRETAQHLWSGNTIAVTLVGGCDPLMRPRWGEWQRCSEEFVTGAQLEAGMAVIEALQAKFELRCEEVYGHGDLQFDRESFEGFRLSRMVRAGCAHAENAVVLPLQAPLPGTESELTATTEAVPVMRSSSKSTDPNDS